MTHPTEDDVPLRQPTAAEPVRRVLFAPVPIAPISQYLAQLNHARAGPRRAGAIAPGKVTVQHAAHSTGHSADAVYVRTHQDRSRTGRLRAYACRAGEPPRRAVKEQP
ncbi:DUF6182 family protein [Streptomyces sp. NBC_00859]|uniref:DUF6182 family protein n=1 Tax=Streptomyces sp. NBC_00859 TaxID=2903682 RepID=UPI003864AC05